MKPLNILLMLSCLLLCACAGFPPKQVTPTQPSPTLNASPTPTTTPVPTPTLTPSPIRTLTPQQQLDAMNLLDQKPGCSLPCWNGITPGLSTSGELQGFFARLGVDFRGWDSSANAVEGQRIVQINDFPKGTISNPPLTFLVDWSAGIVRSVVFTYWAHPEQFAFNTISSVLGEPDRITFFYSQGYTYNFELLYPAKQILIQFNGEILERSDDLSPFYICPNSRDHQIVDVGIYSSEWYSEGIREDYGELVDLNDELSMTKEELWQKLKDPEACLPYP